MTKKIYLLIFALCSLFLLPGKAQAQWRIGAFGVNGTTPIWGYIPKYVCLYPNKDGEYGVVEGYGFEPDIECPLDVNLWQTTGRDNQLEKAIDYIKNK